MNKYELALLIKPLSPEEITNKVVPEVFEQVKALGGNISLKLEWEKRHLAYEVNGHNEGFYKFYKLEIAAESLGALDKFLRLHKEILRFLIISEDNL